MARDTLKRVASCDIMERHAHGVYQRNGAGISMARGRQRQQHIVNTVIMTYNHGGVC